AGMGGSPSVWEGPRGIAAALSDSPDIGRPLGEPDVSAVSRVTFKPFPCSRAGHAALTGLEALGFLDPDRIRQIDVATYPYAVTVSERSRGDTPIAAQAHIPSILALAIAHGGLEPGVAFAADRLADPRVRRLIACTHVTVDPELWTDGPRLRRASVRVTFDDGRSVDATRNPRWGSDDPASDEQLRERAGRLAGDALARNLWSADPAMPIRRLISGLALPQTPPSAGPDG
ncbi:MAG: MmgE/PrpD family protein, partial [Acidobacteriota bacterium]|nr:MmgE/PrpD family protein [Acidobacteriota bacterium]